MNTRPDISFGYLRIGTYQVHFVTCDTDTIDANGNDLRFARFAVNNIAAALREVQRLREAGEGLVKAVETLLVKGNCYCEGETGNFTHICNECLTDAALARWREATATPECPPGPRS